MKISSFPPTTRRSALRSRTAAAETTATSDTVTLSNPTRVGIASWAVRGIALAMAATLALAGPAALAADLPSRVEMQTATGPLHPPIAPGGSAFDRSPNEIRQATANSVTADQLKPGQPRFQAGEPNQMSKHYYQPEIETAIRQAQQSGTLTPEKLAELMARHQSPNGGPLVRSGNSFRYCISQNPDTLACNAVISNQLAYRILSCQYKGEDGKLATVIHRSAEHQYTHSMQRSVCGGHRLEPDRSSGFTEWKPVQVSPEGAPLYLNPANIIAVLPDNPH